MGIVTITSTKEQIGQVLDFFVCAAMQLRTPLTETRQLELPSPLGFPRGILPSLQTLLIKTK